MLGLDLFSLSAILQVPVGLCSDRSVVFIGMPWLLTRLSTLLLIYAGLGVLSAETIYFVDNMLESFVTNGDERRPTLSDSAFERLRAAIIEGELPPGARINEPRISRQYGISRGPLREAIRRLAGNKLVEIRANVGARVVSLNRAQALEIYQIREALEGLACRLAAELASSEDCAGLRALLASHEARIQSDNWRQYYQEAGDWDFHYRVVQLSGNARLFNLLCEELYDLLRLYRLQSASEPERPVQAFKEHHQIVDAIAARDGELAELLMRRHISGARETLLAQFGSEV